MIRNKLSSLVRLLPSLTDVAFLMPVVFLFAPLAGAKHMLSDGDTGWHIRTGEWIVANGRIPHQDIFSFTKPGEPWFAWEWLWDVLFAQIHQHAGLAGVVLASLFVLAVTYALLFRLTRRKCANVLLAIAATFMAAAGSSVHWLARPHLFTLLFVVIFCSVLERAQEGRTRLLTWLPVLSVIWVNLHAGFFIGILLIAAYAAGELATAMAEAQPERRRAALARGRPYLLSALGCVAASLVNPYFYHLHVCIYQFLADPYAFRHINEYQSLNFQHPLARFFEPMILMGMAAAAWNLYQKRFTQAFLILGCGHLALYSVRNMPIFLIVAAPVVAAAVHEWLLRLSGANVAGWLKRAAAAMEALGAEIGATDRIPRLHLASAAGLVIVTAIFFAPAPPAKFRAEYDSNNYPAAALRVLREPGSAKRVFTDDEWGDYLIYRLYPSTKVFVDGRADFYGAKFNEKYEKYIDVMNVKHGWEAWLNQYGVDTIVLPPDASLAGALKESHRWRVIYDDGIAIVFRAARADRLAGEQVSAVPTNGGMERGRKITQTEKRDLPITNSNLRRETL
jgi:hypothetical protein